MSVQSVALASLAVTYSDSDGEDDVDVDDEPSRVPFQAVAPHNNQVGQPAGITSAIFAKFATNSPVIPINTHNIDNAISFSNVKPKVQHLVSYFDDSFVRDEEITVIPDELTESSKSGALLPLAEVLLDDLIPPGPPGSCPPDLQEKIAALHRKMEDGLDLNQVIQERKDFKNPSLYEKLIQFCSVNELGTNYPPEVFDSFKWEKESHYEELERTRVSFTEKLMKTKAKIHVISGTAKRPSSSISSGENGDRRKIGKWDQVTSGTAVVKPTLAKFDSSAIKNDGKCKIVVASGSVPKRRLL